MPAFLQNTQATQPSSAAVQFTAADTTVAKGQVGAVGGPWHLFELTICSDDTAARVVDFFIRIASTNFLIGSVAIPAGSGVGGLSPVNFIADKMPASLVGLDFPSAVTLQAAMETTITAAKTVTITAWYAQY